MIGGNLVIVDPLRRTWVSRRKSLLLRTGDTYGLMLSVDRRDVINDDLGAITTVPRKLGRGSGLKMNDVFWGTFLNNAAFFTAASGDLPDRGEQTVRQGATMGGRRQETAQALTLYELRACAESSAE